MFDTLEEIKSHCDQTYVVNPLLSVEESEISASQVPPKRSFQFRLHLAPPLTGQEQVRGMNQLKERIEGSGFAAEVSFGKLRQGGLSSSVVGSRQAATTLCAWWRSGISC